MEDRLSSRRVLQLHLNNLLLLFFKLYIIIPIAVLALSVVKSYYWPEYRNTAEPLYDIFRMQLLLAVPVYLYFFRQHVKNIFLFFLGHAAAFLILIPLAALQPTVTVPAEAGQVTQVSFGIWTAIFGAPAVLIHVAYSMLDRFKDLSDRASVGALITMGVYYAAVYLAIEYLNLGLPTVLQPYYLIMALVTGLAYFMDLHTRNVDETLNNVEEMLNQPAAKIRRINNRFMGAFAAIMVVLAVLAVVFRLDQALLKVITSVWSLFLMAIRAFFSLFNRESAPAEESLPPEEAQPSGGDEFGGLPAGEASPFWEVMSVLLYAALAIGAVVGLVYGVYRFYRWYYSHRVKTVTADEYEETSDYMEEKEMTPPKSTGSFWDLFRLPNDKKIRKLYYKKLSGPMKEGRVVRPSDTPEEVLVKMPGAGIETLSEVYEKARYSDEEITKDDVKRAGG